MGRTTTPQGNYSQLPHQQQSQGHSTPSPFPYNAIPTGPPTSHPSTPLAHFRPHPYQNTMHMPHQHPEAGPSDHNAVQRTHGASGSRPAAREMSVGDGGGVTDAGTKMTRFRSAPAKPRKARKADREIVAVCDGRCGVPTCRQSFTRQYDAERHVKEQAARSSGNQQYNCRGCELGFQRSDALRKHERDVHGW